MANALHFVKHNRQVQVVQQVRGYLKPGGRASGGRLILVEYNTNGGNYWVPYPLSFDTWSELARKAGFEHIELLATHPSSFLGEFNSALSL